MMIDDDLMMVWWGMDEAVMMSWWWFDDGVAIVWLLQNRVSKIFNGDARMVWECVDDD